ncbi:hypothetical protein [Pseudomonas sp. N040]|uniref:hypothetical protein n=1 Tax=Pseudomonas sp. N040 TaxID=2785325 RepID=UPI0018A3343C|nr:hypothetical protein [Pseudomonas sp. N040]MBF7731390.1 hypothetical protein [Pseudomonas sp. N040]MBW7015033.1 hypothetical protein [Pseudomonas sp. N040]
MKNYRFEIILAGQPHGLFGKLLQEPACWRGRHGCRLPEPKSYLLDSLRYV